MLAEGELPPRVEEQSAFTARDFTVPDRVKKRIDERGARNTKVNRSSTRARFESWCAAEGRVAQPTTTTANVAAYFGYLMETGKDQAGTKYSPDTLLAYLTRIVSGYPKGDRPDGSLVREMIEDYRLEEYIPAGGEKEQSAGLTLRYLVKVLEGIDEGTGIGRRDAAMLVLQYGMLYRSIEVTNLLVRQIRVDTDGVWVWTAKSKTRRKGKGRWRFIRDRDDLRIVARVRAWLADLRELREPTEHNQNPPGGDPAYQPNKPLFRALTTTGNLKRRANATIRGLFLTGRAVNEMVKARAKAAGVSIISGLKVTSHSLRAGPNTDMAEALVPLAERNQAGDWTSDSTLADDVYNRPDGTIDVSKHDPLDPVPLFGALEKEPDT
ncbi:tyrosine-type recombinase/integrase [Streptomyces lydicus]|uniref:tyrosine-type recombinase/integrase n=1 Tax=Streptomyces lydicus TaxID=47763 RepID=UPI00344A16FE